jgi:hypothetical protein
MSGMPGNADVPVGMVGNNADGDVGAPRKFPWTPSLLAFDPLGGRLRRRLRWTMGIPTTRNP